jgi:tetratricopeptide (TPR) repeat protein
MDAQITLFCITVRLRIQRKVPMFRSSLCRFVALAALATPAGIAHGADPYLNQSIVPKFEHLTARADSQPVGTEMDFDWPLPVERVNGQWLWITDDGHFSVAGQPRGGWVSKNDVVLINNDPIAKKSAIDYFTECLERDHHAGWAYWFRGVLLAYENEDWPAAQADLEKAVACAPELDSAIEWLAYCEYHRARVENAGTFAKLHIPRLKAGKPPRLSEDDVPSLIKCAIDHYRKAARICPRPSTFCDWGDALAVRDFDPFQRQIWIFYFEDPDLYSRGSSQGSEEFIRHRRELSPFYDGKDPSEDGGRSAICLYDHALKLFPKYADAHYGRGCLFEYAAAYRVYQMTQGQSWKELTHAERIDRLTKAIHYNEDKTATLQGSLQTETDQLERLAALDETPFSAWRIHQLSEKCKKTQVQIDCLEEQTKNSNGQLTKENRAVAANQEGIDSLQRETFGQIRFLVRKSLDDYTATVVADQTRINAFRDRAAVELLEIDPTGRHPRKEREGFDPTKLAADAEVWAEKATVLNDYKDDANIMVLPVFAAALNATKSYDEAIRRELADWELMNDEQKEIARSLIDLYKSNKDKAPVEPK